MSTTRWSLVLFGSLLLAPLAILGFRPSDGGHAPPTSRILWEGDDSAQVVAFSPDGRALAFGTGVFNGSDGVGVLDVATGDQVASFSGHKNHILALAFSADGQTLTTVSYEAVKRWDLAAGKEHTMVAPPATAYSPNLTLSADGSRLALVDKETSRSLRVFQLAETPICLQDWESRYGPTRFAFSLDGRLLAAGYGNGAVRLWDIDKKQERGPLTGSDQSLTAIAFSPDGVTLATAGMEGREGTVQLWDLTTGTACGSAERLTACISSLAFSPDGQTLASGGVDHTIRLWDVASRAERAVLRGHTGWVNAVAFAPDGRTLASASSDRTVRLWEVSAAE